MSLIYRATASTSGVSSDNFVETDNSVTIFSPSGESHFSIKDYLARLNVPLEPWEDGEHNLGNEDHSWKDIYTQGFLRAGAEFGILDDTSTRYYHDAVQTVLSSPDNSTLIAANDIMPVISKDGGTTWDEIATVTTNAYYNTLVDTVYNWGDHGEQGYVKSNELTDAINVAKASITKLTYSDTGVTYARIDNDDFRATIDNEVLLFTGATTILRSKGQVNQLKVDPTTGVQVSNNSGSTFKTVATTDDIETAKGSVVTDSNVTLKYKVIDAVLPASGVENLTISHGLDGNSSIIHSISGGCEFYGAGAPTQHLPPNHTHIPQSNYEIYADASNNIVIWMVDAENLVNMPIRLLITYQSY